MNAAQFAARVNGRQSGTGWSARCPAHDDRNPSLSIWEGKDGRVMFACKASCEKPAVLAALGLTWADVCPEKPQAPRIVSPDTTVTWYDYQHPDGALAYRVRREDGPNGKDVRPYSASGSVGLNGTGRILYRLPELIEGIAEGRTAHIVEGENKVEELRARGLCATTSGSATSWRQEFAQHLIGANVVIIPDNDTPGEKYAATIAESLQGVAASVRIVRLPGLPPKGDVVDWFKSGRTLEQLLAEIDAPTAEPERTRWRLDELRDRPDLLTPPVAVVPRVAWRSRCTLFASGEKLGKSTFLAYVAAQASHGRAVLGQPCQPVTVLVFGLEEFVGDVARRLLKFDAEPTKVHIVTTLPLQPVAALAELRRHVHETGATLVIVDTLIAYSAGGVTDAAASAQIQPIVQALTHYAHDSGIALILVHHGRKSDGKYRDSSAIGAAVDVIIEMGLPPNVEETTLRIVRARGRVPTANFQFRYEYGEFELIASTDLPSAAGDLSTTLAAIATDDLALAQDIIAFVKKYPGTSQKRIRDGVTGGNARIDRAIEKMLASGAIVDGGNGTSHKFYLPDAAPRTLDEGVASGVAPSPSPGDPSGRPSTSDRKATRATLGRGVGDPPGEVSQQSGQGGRPASLSPIGERKPAATSPQPAESEAA